MARLVVGVRVTLWVRLGLIGFLLTRVPKLVVLGRVSPCVRLWSIGPWCILMLVSWCMLLMWS